MAGTIVLMTFLTRNLAFAQAVGDRVIIDGNGCQVTEEDYYPDYFVDNRYARPPWALEVFWRQDVYLRIDFPDAHWRFGLRNQGLKGLSLVDVSLLAGQFTQPQYMIKHAGLADIFVPYDKGDFDPYDMRWDTTYNSLLPIEDADLPAQLGSSVVLRHPTYADAPIYSEDRVPKVAVECRETGVAWLCKNKQFPARNIRRRAYEVVVWAVYDGGNYKNIIEYDFREDGSIGFRYGATGQDAAHKGSHIHNGLWRVSTQLFAQTTSQVKEFQHVSSPAQKSAADSDILVLNETPLMWDPLQFTNVIVESSTQTNSYGNLMGYEFAPWNRTGTSRQRPQISDSPENWVLNDFYVTNDNPGEDGFGFLYPNDWRFNWHSPDQYMLSYLNGEQLGATGDGIVVWYTSSAHHEPSDLDNAQGSGDHSSGVTLVHWSGFDMEPHNLFDYNPLGGPKSCMF